MTNYGGFYNVNPMAQADIFWNASALITQRLFKQQNGLLTEPIFNHVWVVTTGITILGFLAYRILINSWLRSENFLNGPAQVAFDDTLRFVTMFAVLQLASGNSLTDPKWIKETTLFIGSLVLYDLVARNAVMNLTRNLNSNVSTGVNNVIKFGAVFTAHNFALGNSFTREWGVTTVGYLTGVALYDMVLSQYLDKYLQVNAGPMS